MRTFPILVVAPLLLGLSGVGCNRSPVITLIEGPSSVEKGTSATFTCHADDPDGNSLSYEWSCSSGQMASPTGQIMTWTAPSANGSETVQATVKDPLGASDVMSKSVAVTTAYTQNIVSGTINVPDGGYLPYEVSVTSDMLNASLVGVFDVYANDDGNLVRVQVMAEADYVKWTSGYEVTPLYNSGWQWSGSFRVWLTLPGTYYLVYDEWPHMDGIAVATTVDLEYEK